VLPGIRHFRFMLEGRAFTIYTNHKPLTTAINRASDPWKARQCRQLAYVAEYTSDIRHIAGTSNVVADALSRPPVPTSPSTAAACVKAPSGSQAAARREGKSNSSSSSAVASVVAHVPRGDVDYAAMAAAQGSCPEVQKVAASPALRVRRVQIHGADVLCDVSTGVAWPLVPAAFKTAVFAAIHGLAHPGIRATRCLASSRFVWHGCASDVAGWCRDCQTCQRGKVTQQLAAATQSIPVPEQRFTHLHVDLVGPLPTLAEGFKYLFTIIDQSTRWVEAIPVKNMEAATIADALVAGWVSRFGVPAVITSDRGTQFTSAVWEALCKRLHIQHITTTAFHPCSNGMVERCHRQLKDVLPARSAANDWPDHLPWVLLGLRAAPKEDSAVSSADMVLGDPLVLPGQPPAAGESPPPQRSYRDALLGAQPAMSLRDLCRRPNPGSRRRWRRARASTSGWRHPAAICAAVRGVLRSPGARREGFPAAGGRQRGGGVCGLPQAAHGGGAVQPAAPPKRGRPPGSAASSTNAAFGRQR
jgi:transposase InsO family protein